MHQVIITILCIIFFSLCIAIFHLIQITSARDNRSWLELKYISATLAGLFLTASYYYLCQKILLDINFFTITFIILTGLTMLFLFYLSVYDALFMEIPFIPSLLFLFSLIIFNVLGLIILGIDGKILLWSGNIINPTNNLLFSLIAAIFILIIVIATHEQGMGSGDIILAAIFGVILGGDKVSIGFYITIFSASIFGLIYATRIGKFKGVPIPFVPFITFGIIAAFSFSTPIADFIMNLSF